MGSGGAQKGAARPGSAGYTYKHGWVPVAGSGAVDKRSKAKQKAMPFADPGISVTTQDGRTTVAHADAMPDGMQVMSTSARPEPPTEAEKDATHAYTRTAYNWMNGSLRGTHKLELTDDQQQQINHLRGLLARQEPSTEDREMYRGVTPDFDLSQFEPGDEFEDRGFVSVSASADVANDIFGSAGGVMRIQVPAGTRSLDINATVGDRITKGFGYIDEKEHLLQPGTRFRVVGRTDNGIDVEVVQ